MNHDPGNAADRPTNRLAGESSPYLRQHQYNPVDWYPWGDEAFEKARRENKPLLISIGYSACHWCHVMERESFENPEIARVLNQSVIAVKVDREERPDVDKIYMEVCIALTGQGGWPLNVFVTPKLKPFYAGTYFPPDDRYGRPGFPRVLQRIHEAWITDSTGLTLQAAKLHDEMDAHAKTLPGDLSSDVWTKAIAEALSRFDDQRGGFGGAPKFPPDQWMAMLLAAGYYSGDQRAAGAVDFTLLRMAQGGIYDQLGGGFARYSVDADWLVPHFEKMLYNQALLVPVFVSAYRRSGESRFLQPAVETLDWVLRDLADESGLYYCALDADSEGEEGRFYVWTPAQIREILEPREADAFIKRYGVTDQGNFEDSTSILYVAQSYRQIATEMEIEAEEVTQLIQSAKAKLLDARAKREWPGLDYKCLTGWNGLMLTAFCSGYLATRDDRYLHAARGIADAASRVLRIDGNLFRSYTEGKTSIPALLEDYAYLGNGLVDLYEVTGEDAFRTEANRIAEEILAQFDDESNGGFFFHGQHDPNLISRTKSLNDDAIPSASACAAQLLFRLSAVEDNVRYQDRARAAVRAAAGGAERFAGSFGATLIAWTYAPENVVHVTLPANNNEEFQTTAFRNYIPGLVISYADRPGALVCMGTQCLAEADSVELLDQQLKNLRSG